jgi:hypothetical protein
LLLGISKKLWWTMNLVEFLLVLVDLHPIEVVVEQLLLLTLDQSPLPIPSRHSPMHADGRGNFQHLILAPSRLLLRLEDTRIMIFTELFLGLVAVVNEASEADVSQTKTMPRALQDHARPQRKMFAFRCTIKETKTLCKSTSRFLKSLLLMRRAGIRLRRRVSLRLVYFMTSEHRETTEKTQHLLQEGISLRFLQALQWKPMRRYMKTTA